MANIMISDVMEKIIQTPTSPGKADIFMLHSDIDGDVLINKLVRYFGENDEREDIRLHVDGKHKGLLTRVDFYGLVGHDISSYAGLPGISISPILIEMRCRVSGCEGRKFVMYFDEDYLPKCPHHPDLAMEIIK